MSLFRKKRKDRPIERVLRHERIQEYLKANRLSVSPPYSETEWNYWHINQDGGIKPITADELLLQYQEWKSEHYVSAGDEAAAQHLYPLRPELRHEIDRLKQILAAHGKEFVTKKGVPKARLWRTQQKLGYQIDPDLCAFYALTDGSPNRDDWFAVGIQNPVPVDFRCLDDSLKNWRMCVENEAMNREYGKQVNNEALTRDPQIALGLWFPPQWWSFAGNDSPVVMMDTCPSACGKQGQIIAFYHDPDELFCIADNFLDFFRKSNDFLETRWDEIFLYEE